MRPTRRAMVLCGGGATGALVATFMASGVSVTRFFSRLTQMSVAGQEPGEIVRIRQRGMWGVWNQSFRILTTTRLDLGLRAFQAAHPETALALVTSSELDETLFVTNPMNTAARALVAQRAYDSTLALMRGPRGDTIRAVVLGSPGAACVDGVPAPQER